MPGNHSSPSPVEKAPARRIQRVVFRLAFELDSCHFERFVILARTSAQGVPLGPSRSSLSSRPIRLQVMRIPGPPC
jgi:hypothetical protein